MPIEITDEMIDAGVQALRRKMRDDTFIMDHSGNTLRMIVREIFVSMMERV